MAKKAELLCQAKKLKLDVSEKNTIAEIEAALNSSDASEAASEEAPKAEAAKAGKRSKKALEAAEVQQAKASRKAAQSAEAASEGGKSAAKSQKPARPKHERKGKNYREAFKLVDKSKNYPLKDALALAQATSKVKFDASVELHVNLNVDPKQANQNVRGTLVLPHGTGKAVAIAVFDDTKISGADITGIDNITKQLEKGEVGFDILIASPVNMAKLGKYARLLGPRGLMPNPKSGTVTADLNRAVAEAKAGKIDYRVDSTGIIHAAIGKASFSTDQLLANAEALLGSIRSAKPSSIKGSYVQSIYVATTMGPSVSVAVDA